MARKWRRKFQYNDLVSVDQLLDMPGSQLGRVKVALRKGQNNRVTQGWYVVWFDQVENQPLVTANVHWRNMRKVEVHE